MTCLRLCCCSNAFGRSDIDIRIFIELFLFFFFFTKSKIPSPQFQLKRKHRNSDSVPVNRGLVEYQRLFNVARIPRASKQRRKRCLRATWRDVRHQSVVFGRGGHDRSIGREKEEKKKRKKRVNSSFMQGCARVREAKGTLVARFEPRRASSSLVASVSCVRQQHVNNFTRLFHPVSGIRAIASIELACRTNFVSPFNFCTRHLDSNGKRQSSGFSIFFYNIYSLSDECSVGQEIIGRTKGEFCKVEAPMFKSIQIAVAKKQCSMFLQRTGGL